MNSTNAIQQVKRDGFIGEGNRSFEVFTVSV